MASAIFTEEHLEDAMNYALQAMQLHIPGGQLKTLAEIVANNEQYQGTTNDDFKPVHDAANALIDSALTFLEEIANHRKRPKEH